MRYKVKVWDGRKGPDFVLEVASPKRSIGQCVFTNTVALAM